LNTIFVPIFFIIKYERPIINAGIIIARIIIARMLFTIIFLLKSTTIGIYIFLKNNMSKIYANKGANCIDVITINLLNNISSSKMTANIIKSEILKQKTVLWFIFAPVR
jgi:hypothetical protein